MRIYKMLPAGYILYFVDEKPYLPFRSKTVPIKLQKSFQIFIIAEEIELGKLLVDIKNIPRIDTLSDQTMGDLPQNITLAGSTLPHQYLNQLIADIIGNLIRIMLSQISQSRNIAIPEIILFQRRKFFVHTLRFYTKIHFFRHKRKFRQIISDRAQCDSSRFVTECNAPTATVS